MAQQKAQKEAEPAQEDMPEEQRGRSFGCNGVHRNPEVQGSYRNSLVRANVDRMLSTAEGCGGVEVEHKSRGAGYEPEPGAGAVDSKVLAAMRRVVGLLYLEAEAVPTECLVWVDRWNFRCWTC